ncbi:MAG: hypothetical protein K0S66_286 [Sphingomonas sp.]|nr:hypothetical protein [Sphingomonas sp.]
MASGFVASDRSGCLLPAACLILLPVAPLNALALVQRPPSVTRLNDVLFIEEVKGALEIQRILPPCAIHKRDVTSAVSGIHVQRDKDRLVVLIRRTSTCVRQEAVCRVFPQKTIDRRLLRLIPSNNE